MLSPARRQITHALLTRAPLYSGRSPFSFDLHVLGTPPAFVLSQDQTLHLILGCRAPSTPSGPRARSLFVLKTGTHSLPSSQPDFQGSGFARQSGPLQQRAVNLTPHHRAVNIFFSFAPLRSRSPETVGVVLPPSGGAVEVFRRVAEQAQGLFWRGSAFFRRRRISHRLVHVDPFRMRC